MAEEPIIEEPKKEEIKPETKATKKEAETIFENNGLTINKMSDKLHVLQGKQTVNEFYRLNPTDKTKIDNIKSLLQERYIIDDSGEVAGQPYFYLIKRI